MADIVEKLRWDRPDEPDFWQSEPPAWAKDPFNDDEVGKCVGCGSWLDCVRPGKFQCPACGSDADKAARWKAADTITQLRAEVAERDIKLAACEQHARIVRHERDWAQEVDVPQAESQAAEARNKALEEAAAVAANTKTFDWGGGDEWAAGYVAGKDAAASAIRSLKDGARPKPKGETK